MGRQAPSGPTGVTHGQVQWGGCLPGRELDTHRQCPPLRIPGEEAATLQGSRASRPGRSHGGSGSPPPPLSSSIRSVMQKYLEDRAEVTFEKIFSQKLGEYGGGSANPRASAPPPSPAARPGGGGRRPLGLPLCGTPADQAVCPPLCQEISRPPWGKLRAASEPRCWRQGQDPASPSPWLLPREAPDAGWGPSSLPGPPGKFLLWGFCFRELQLPLGAGTAAGAVGGTDRKGRGPSCGACRAVVAPAPMALFVSNLRWQAPRRPPPGPRP